MGYKQDTKYAEINLFPIKKGELKVVLFDYESLYSLLFQ